MDSWLASISQNSKGMVMGANNEVNTTRDAESAGLPFAMSVRAGDAIAAGIEQSNIVPMAKFRSTNFKTKKNLQEQSTY